ncbi:exonuclease SbcCD subunit D [Ruminobacter sp.]|uniref:metallophosphoesterase family protein n=1 Tax=Ruminobacter sp. TaxID=2774296 RepID=UPI00386DE495
MKDSVIRILHTSDWHLGKRLHEFDRSIEYRKFKENLLRTIESEHPHLLLLAGDVFDTINPSLEAEKFLGTTLNEIRRRHPGLHIVITCGNHDSARKIDSVSAYMECCDRLMIVGELPVVYYEENPSVCDVDYEKLIYPVRTDDGKLQALVVAMPFLSTTRVLNLGVNRSHDGSETDYESGVRNIYQGCLDFIRNSEEYKGADVPIIAMGHFFVKSSTLSGSEEDKATDMIGGEQGIGISVFDGYDYVALGHIHLRQNIGGSRRVRYSGSPLPINFGECEYRNGVDIVDVLPAGSPDDGGRYNIEVVSRVYERAVDFIRIPARRGMACEEEVLQTLNNMQISAGEKSINELPFCSIFAEYNQENSGFDCIRSYREILDKKIGELSGKAFRLCDFKLIRKEGDGGTVFRQQDVQSLDDISSPIVLASRMYEEVHKGKEMPEELVKLLSEIIAEAENGKDDCSGKSA